MAKLRLPSVDAFGAMLDMAFPDGPLSDSTDNNQPENQAINQAIEQSLKQTINIANKQTNKQSSKQSSKQTNKQTNKQTIKQSTGAKRAKSAWLPLNEKQGRILLFLFEEAGGITNMDIICEKTGIAYGTARIAVDVLLKEHYMLEKKRHVGHAFRGFTYTMNNHMCSLYASQVKNEQSIEQDSKQTNKQAMTVVVSSDFNKQLLTTITEFDMAMQDPELAYWREKGVTGRQVSRWCEEFQMDLSIAVLCLKYCRYEMVVLNQEEEKAINNPVNWFYKVLARTSGCYPRPAGYKSAEELRIEALEIAAAETKRLRERRKAAEEELEFERVLSEGGSAYGLLLGKVSDFAREMGGDVLERELKALFLSERK